MSYEKEKPQMRTKLSITYAILTTTLIGCAAILFYKYNQYGIYQEGTNNVSQVSETAMAQIDSRLTTMDQASIDVLSEPNFQSLWQEVNEKESFEKEKAMKRILTKAYATKSDIRRITVYNLDGNYCSTGIYSVSKEEVKERIETLEKQYDMSLYNRRVYLPPHLDFWYEECGTYVISEVKPIKNAEGIIEGYIEVQQNSFYLKDICDLKWNGKQLNIMVFMEDSNELFYMNIDNTKENRAYAKKVEGITKGYVRSKDDKNSIYAMATSNYYSCKTVAILEKKILNESAEKMLNGIVTIILILILFTTGYSFWVTKVIMGPINLLVKRMKNTDLHNINEKIEIKIQDRETQILLHSFEQMAKRLNEALVRQKKLEQIQTKTLFSALQSEMGPHFLYNSLGGIANLCENGENEAAADVCYSLTEILRYASNYEASEVMVKEEIENLNAYMAIMKSRYRQRLEFEMHMDQEASYVMIPKLTFQPLVENAIRYSLAEHEKVIIKMYIVLFDDEMIVEIKDNGCGITKEAGEIIKRRIEQFQDTHTEFLAENHIQFGGLGLSGTLIRLSIYYGNDFWYELQDNNDEGGTSIIFGMKWDK